MAFELPIKGDMDRLLSNLMHDARHKLMIESNRIMAEAAQAGALQSNRVLVTIFKMADDLHKAAMQQATTIMLNFIDRLKQAPNEITTWARPHLENLGNSVLGVIKPNGFPTDHQRLIQQYLAVFNQRLDGVLRDVEIGHVAGAGFERAEKMESKDAWISAAKALQLLAPALEAYSAQMTICQRAHAGLIRARAEQFMIDEKSAGPRDVPKEFWWAEGEQALEQNWTTGDFETWLKQTTRLRAFNVSFARQDIEKLIPAERSPAQGKTAATQSPARNKGGRPKHEFWEELWVEIARQLYIGDLKPKTQADIEQGMHQWISDNGHEAGGTPVRDRARMLWRALEKDGN